MVIQELKNNLQQFKRNAWVYNLSSSTHITHFCQLLLRNKNVSSKSMFRIEHPSEHRVQTADDKKSYFTSFLDNFDNTYFRNCITF